mmetsp:Transcript_11216/g.34115  ORF Transcript_11216/g.34115 Transcript_11216/m.34115 type:complete len:318 (-) Transcript_11216:71-1024(-)
MRTGRGRRHSKIFVHVPESTLTFMLKDSLASVIFGSRAAKVLRQCVRRCESFMPVLQFWCFGIASCFDYVFRDCVEIEDANPPTSTCTRPEWCQITVTVLYCISTLAWLAMLLTSNVEIFKVALQMMSSICVIIASAVLAAARGHIAVHTGYWGADGVFYISGTFLAGLVIATGDALSIPDRCLLHRYTTVLLGLKHLFSTIMATRASKARPGVRAFLSAGNLDFSSQDLAVASRTVLLLSYFIAATHAWREPNAFTFIQAKLRTTTSGPVLERETTSPGRVAPRSRFLSNSFHGFRSRSFGIERDTQGKGPQHVLS